MVLRHCIPAASVPMAGVDFDARLAVRGVGMVDICSLSAPLHRWERTARYLRQGPDDDLWLGYMQGGYGQLEQGGRKAALDFGFSDFSHFSHAFRKAFGISPRSLLPKEQQGATPSNRHTGSDS